MTFANTLGKAPATVNHTDNLSRVLDDATVVTPPALATGSGLTVGPISGRRVHDDGRGACRGDATVTFSVRVNTPDTGDHQLVNFVVPTGTQPPATCVPTTPDVYDASGAGVGGDEVGVAGSRRRRWPKAP